jgi:N-acetylglucosamine kinase-like BadF-type ATPase
MDLRIPESGSSATVWVDAACVGLSGISHPASRAIVRAAFETAGVGVAGPRILVSDAEIVLEEAFGAAAPSGVVLIAGTGSIALARDAGGRLVRAGGAGPGHGDEGGGHWIGREAIASGWSGPRGEPCPVAEVASAVVLAARQGDARALAILRRAAPELAELVRSAAEGAGLRGSFAVRVAGGLAVHSEELVAALSDELARAAPGARLDPIVGDPLHGALRLALRTMARGADVPRGW